MRWIDEDGVICESFTQEQLDAYFSACESSPPINTHIEVTTHELGPEWTRFTQNAKHLFAYGEWPDDAVARYLDGEFDEENNDAD